MEIKRSATVNAPSAVRYARYVAIYTVTWFAVLSAFALTNSRPNPWAVRAREGLAFGTLFTIGIARIEAWRRRNGRS